MLKLITRVTAIAGATVLLLASPALAGTITTPPPPGPFLVPGDAAGNPQAFTVVASGFPPNSPVLVEQCDGVAPTTAGWDPTLNCDLVSSPAAAIADASGVATFPTTDPNRRFTPFKGESPQSIFNCLAPGQASPNNGLPDFTNCKIRVSSNNSAVTADQAFLPITLPGVAVETPPTPQNQAVTVGVGATVTLTLSATSTDSTPVTDYQLTSLPASGSLTVNGAAAVINTPYAPNNGSSLDVVYTAPATFGAQSFTFQARDSVSAFGAGGTGTVTISVGTAPVSQEITQQVTGGQLVLSCSAPGSPDYPLLTCPPVALPEVTLDGTDHTGTPTPMSPLYVSDNRGDLTASWSLTAQMLPTTSIPGCTTADFCNSDAGADLSNEANHIAASNLSLSGIDCTPFAGNLNAAPTAGPDADFSAAITLCTANPPEAGGTFSVTGDLALDVPAATAAGLFKGTVQYLVS